MNIKNAYVDERFNTDVDKKTGYRTRNILCMPIQGKTGVTAVVLLINRYPVHINVPVPLPYSKRWYFKPYVMSVPKAFHENVKHT